MIARHLYQNQRQVCKNSNSTCLSTINELFIFSNIPHIYQILIPLTWYHLIPNSIKMGEIGDPRSFLFRLQKFNPPGSGGKLKRLLILWTKMPHPTFIYFEFFCTFLLGLWSLPLSFFFSFFFSFMLVFLWYFLFIFSFLTCFFFFFEWLVFFFLMKSFRFFN